MSVHRLIPLAAACAASTVYKYPLTGAGGSFMTGWVQENDNSTLGGVSTSGTDLTIIGNERIYLVGNRFLAQGADDWTTNSYKELNLLGKTLSWTQDVSNVRSREASPLRGRFAASCFASLQISRLVVSYLSR